MAATEVMEVLWRESLLCDFQLDTSRKIKFIMREFLKIEGFTIDDENEYRFKKKGKFHTFFYTIIIIEHRVILEVSLNFISLIKNKINLILILFFLFILERSFRGTPCEKLLLHVPYITFTWERILQRG